jgi:hypothetical protein
VSAPPWNASHVRMPSPSIPNVLHGSSCIRNIQLFCEKCNINSNALFSHINSQRPEREIDLEMRFQYVGNRKGKHMCYLSRLTESLKHHLENPLSPSVFTERFSRLAILELCPSLIVAGSAATGGRSVVHSLMISISAHR